MGPAKLKKGVKRKADTTTPVVASAPFDPTYAPASEKSAKISTRRESGRQIKKVNRDLPEAAVRYFLLTFPHGFQF
jgi:hypothetical protein